MKNITKHNRPIHIVLKEDNSIKYFVYNDLNKKIKEEEIEISLCHDSNVKIHMNNSFCLN